MTNQDLTQRLNAIHKNLTNLSIAASNEIGIHYFDKTRFCRDLAANVADINRILLTLEDEQRKTPAFFDSEQMRRTSIILDGASIPTKPKD